MKVFASLNIVFCIYAINFKQILCQYEDEGYEDLAALMNAMENMKAEREMYPEMGDDTAWSYAREYPNEEIVDLPEKEEVLETVDIGDGKPGSEADVLKHLERSASKIEKKSPEIVPFAAPIVQKNEIQRESRGGQALSDASKMQLIVVGSAFCALATVGLVVGATYVYKRKQKIKASEESGNPIGDLKGQGTGGHGDRKLAQSAQMYHYQHQKQQMIALEKANNEIRPEGSDEESEPENEEGDYTVYECPGLAPTGELEVRNPMFQGEEALIQIDNEEKADK